MGQRIANLRSPRIAVAAAFLLNGGLFGTWASRIPAFVERFDLSADRLGLVLLAMAMGAILSFPASGQLSDRLGACVITRRTAGLYVVISWALAMAPSFWAFAVCVILFGAAQGSLDVAMNAWGAEVEQDEGRPAMSLFHAMFSLGAGLGAASGYLAVRLGLDPGPHFVLAGFILGAASLATASVPWTSRASGEGGGGLALPRGPLVLVGLVAFCASLGEGAMADWSAVFLYSATGVTEAQSALGYAAFSAAMVIVRLTGDRLVHRWGVVRCGRLSGLVAALGAMMAIFGNAMQTVLLGFTLMGIGYAVLAPLAYSRAAADPDVAPGVAIASVAALGYGGLLLGPPLIGYIAGALSLKAGFGVLAGLALLVTLLAPGLASPGPGRRNGQKARRLEQAA